MAAWITACYHLEGYDGRCHHGDQQLPAGLPFKPPDHGCPVLPACCNELPIGVESDARDAHLVPRDFHNGVIGPEGPDLRMRKVEQGILKGL